MSQIGQFTPKRKLSQIGQGVLNRTQNEKPKLTCVAKLLIQKSIHVYAIK